MVSVVSILKQIETHNRYPNVVRLRDTKGYKSRKDNMEAITSFGEWVQIRRETLRLTRKVLAQQVGCSAITIKKIERGERRPSVQIAKLLAIHLRIPEAEQRDFIRGVRGEFVADMVDPD